MRVALVAPPFGQTGGPEVVVQNLVGALKELGVDCTLFAPGDWEVPYPFTPTIPQSLWNMADFGEQSRWVRRNLIYGSQTTVLRYQHNFDLIHLHSQRSAYPVALAAQKPCVVTLHSKFDRVDFEQLKEAKVFTVGLTSSQVDGYAVDAIIGNGLPLQNIVPSFSSGKHLLAIGRLNEQKGIHNAIAIAKKAKLPLIIIGRVGVSEERQDYFENFIRPHIDGKNIILIESVDHEKIYDYYRNASFLIHSITQPESNPLVPIEALACGTPVLGTRVAPLPEMFPQSSHVAFFSNSIEDLVDAALHTERFQRELCRAYAEEHFDSKVMAKNYVEVYKQILARS